MKRRYLYHCSVLDQGEVLRAGRRTPIFPDKREPAVPRLCVAPTIPQAMSARLFPSRDVHVYRTPRPMKGVTPFDVWDQRITDERWILPGVELRKFTKIKRAAVDDIFQDVRDWHDRTRRTSSWKMRIAILWRCATALPRYSKGLQWVQEIVDHFDIDPVGMWSEFREVV